MDFNLEEYEKLFPCVVAEHHGIRLVFHTPNRIVLWRAQTLASKEPETLAWIEGFREGATFVDVGANVGVYTLWAALARKARVLAFEPEAASYAILNHNIAINGLGGQVLAYCAGVSDRMGLDRLFLRGRGGGQSGHGLGEALSYDLAPMEPAFVQGSLTVALDALVAQGEIPAPDHVKIDVDGFEHRVIAGMRGLLEQGRLNSLLVELNPALPEHRGVLTLLRDLGFSIRWREGREVAADADGWPLSGAGNFIFSREGGGA